MDGEQHEIRFEIEGLIQLLAQNLYADPDVFLREMIQNAHDSIVKRREVATERGERDVPSGLIRIVPNTSTRTLTITDNGSGLLREEVHRYLSTIGGSGTRELKQRLMERDHRHAVELIGQFGIGLLSAFIVAERVEIVTRSTIEPALQWTSRGDRHYRVEDAERPEVGTTVVLHLKSEHTRYLDVERLRGIVRRYADFIGIPIYLGGEAEPANAVDAPWHHTYRGAGDQRLAYVTYWERRFKDEHSLDVLPLDEPVTCPDPTRPGAYIETRLRGVLGITDRHVPDVNTRGTVDVYVARMFVASANREVLPTWARFIQGVIECSALTPNAARDDVVLNDALAVVREALGRLILGWLIRLSADEPGRFVEIMRWHAYQVLAMSVQDEHEAFFRTVADILPLESDQGPLTVKTYLDHAPALPDGKRVVHYITERGSTNQYYVLCAAKGIRVFDASEPFAERFLQRYARLFPDRVHLSRLDLAGSDVIFEPLPEGHADRERFRDLEAAYASIFPDLRCIARVSRFRPAEVPAVLTETRDQKTRREMKEVAENVVLPAFIRDLVKDFIKDQREPLTLHLNADNPTVVRLARRGSLRDEVATNALISLYNNALMLLARTITPENVRVMFGQYNRVIDLMLGLADDRTKLSGEREALAARVRELEGGRAGAGGLARCVTCFVAMPYDARLAPVFDALKAVLEDAPYFWHVVRADQEARSGMLWESVRDHMARAHCFVAEISEQNPNVMIEVGRMEAFGRPILLLKREGSPDLPADLRGRVYASYAVEGDALIERLRAEIPRHPSFRQQKGERRLSETLLRKSAPDLSEAVWRKLAQGFETCEELLAADASEAAKRIGVSLFAVQAAQAGVRERIGEA